MFIRLFLCVYFFPIMVFAQNQSSFVQQEKVLAGLVDTIYTGQTELERQNACYRFIPKLVETLKSDNSFSYPFNELQGVSVVSPEDDAFRIFTWFVLRDNGLYRHYGVIQINNPDSLVIFPLYDYSDLLANAEDTVLSAQTWYGVMYYNVKLKERRKQKYYTLFGWDGYSDEKEKKIMEILTFEDGQPVFGAPIIRYDKDSIKKRLIITYKEGDVRQVEDQDGNVIEYKEDIGVTLNYDPQLDMVVYDNLIPETPLTEGDYSTYVPDGSYKAFKFKRGKWRYIEKLFDQVFETPPGPNAEK